MGLGSHLSTVSTMGVGSFMGMGSTICVVSTMGMNGSTICLRSKSIVVRKGVRG